MPKWDRGDEASVGADSSDCVSLLVLMISLGVFAKC
ncbi:protein of unknown function [Pseudodesulfovibrio profundus]|uniref:Uncharacterized protein n=1 Tax=Pseudodesulfovibrio profundus TaxID=57320 RepID=A0A2C8FBN4_9BACT|nr:protein of unknown function [Pseudodesulfovibrio profundus]